MKNIFLPLILSLICISTLMAKPIYLSKTDPLYIQIKSRAMNDFREAIKRANPNSEENLAKKTKLKTLSEAKQAEYNDAFIQSLRDYTSQLDFSFEIFMLVFVDFDLNGLNKFMNESDFRVRLITGNKYAAEYWEDGVLANSDENAIIWAKTIMKKYPNNKEALKEVRENYANIRKLMLNGKNERYTETMAFLYTKEKDGTILFHHPGQVMYDLK